MQMPKASDFFPSQYLRCADLNGTEVIATIEYVKTDEFENDGRKQMKPVIYFREKTLKPMVTNKTNFMLIAKACGEDSDGWAGKKVVLYPDTVAFKGTVTEAIRVKRFVTPATVPCDDPVTTI
jgi:hypothetical protein